MPRSKSSKPPRVFPAELGAAGVARIRDGEPWLQVWSEQLAVPLATIARKSGVDFDRLMDIAAERAEPSVDERDAIAAAMGTTVEQIDAEQE